MPQLLFINPNTYSQVSRNIDALFREEAGPAVDLITVTASFGHQNISSRTAVAIAAHAVLDTAARAIAEGAPPDAIIVACFGDRGLAALSGMTGLPVVGGAGLIPTLPGIIKAWTVLVLDPHRAAVRKTAQLAGLARTRHPDEIGGDTVGLSKSLIEAIARPRQISSTNDAR